MNCWRNRWFSVMAGPSVRVNEWQMEKITTGVSYTTSAVGTVGIRFTASSAAILLCSADGDKCTGSIIKKEPATDLKAYGIQPSAGAGE
ncbi:Ail/Lom family outer membrane beta-barrel protein [Escherichia coli]|uniref:Ail/Lom family outer membrane beta-barrel protein n=1 Tax=Escherichia coli TaxID=562 RepID=UPI00399F8820